MRSVLIRATSALLVSALVLFSVAAAKPSSHPTDFVDDATGVAVNFQGSSPSVSCERDCSCAGNGGAGSWLPLLGVLRSR